MRVNLVVLTGAAVAACSTPRIGAILTRMPSYDFYEPDADEPKDRELLVRALRLIAGGTNDVAELAERLGVDEDELARIGRLLRAWGLVLAPSEESIQDAVVNDAGDQFLAREGHVSTRTLYFLSSTVDCLDARAALREATFVLLDEFTGAIADGRLLRYACEVAPPAFAQAVDEPLAARFFAAAAALVVRLGEGRPAGCVAEEVLAVRLIEIASDLLDEDDDLADDETRIAHGQLRGVFELFEDDDVLDMFRMQEPSDAALAGHSPRNLQMGIADQRLSEWFEPFGGVVRVGHLAHEPNG
jgi:hypothetical protein